MPRYPFTPELLDALPEELAELFRGLEITLLKKICAPLKIRGELNESAIQALRALRSHGISLDEINRAIQEAAEISQEKLDALFDDVVARNQAYYKEMISLAKVTEPQRLVDEADIEAIRKQTKGEFTNLTRSVAFQVRSNGRYFPLKPQGAYTWAVDSALLQVESGAISYNEAIRNAVRELADSGIKTATYSGGRMEQIDSVVRRAVLTGVNQVNQKYREQSMDYLETDLVEVTAHLGARNIRRPEDQPWVAHTYFQGRVFYWERGK